MKTTKMKWATCWGASLFALQLGGCSILEILSGVIGG